MNTLRVLSPLSVQHYRRLFAAMVLAVFGQGAWALYLAMQTLDLGATPADLSTVVVWSGVGLLLWSLPAGVVADRLPQRTILIGVMTLNAVAAAVTTWLAWGEAVTFWQLGLSAFLIGASTAFFFPAYTALVPTLVEADELMAVNGLEGAARPVIGQAAAPAVIGAVIGASVPPVGGLVITLAFLMAVLCAVGLPVQVRLEKGGREDSRPHPLRDLVGGFAYVARTPWVAVSVVFAAMMGLLVVGPLEVLLPALLREGYENGAAVYGMILAAVGIGGLVGSLIMGSLRTPQHVLPWMIGLWAVGCVPFALVAVTLHPWVLGTSLLVYGAQIGAGMVIWGTALQERVPLDYLGRVASLDFFVSIAFMPLSISVTGLLAERLGTGTLFVAAGAGPAAVGLVLLMAWALIRRSRRRPGGNGRGCV